MFNFKHDMTTGESPRIHVFSRWIKHFCRDYHFVPTISKTLSEYFFRPPLAIHVCRIKKVNTDFTTTLKHGFRCFFISVSAKRHRPKTETGDLNSRFPYGAIFHQKPSSSLLMTDDGMRYIRLFQVGDL